MAHQDKGQIEEQKNGQSVVPVLEEFKKEAQIDRVLTESIVFRMVVRKDKTAYVCPTAGTLQSVIDPADPAYDTSLFDPIPYSNIEHVCLNQTQIIFTTNDGSTQQLYHGIVEEKFLDGEPEVLIPQSQNPRTSHRVEIKQIYGPLNFKVRGGVPVEAMKIDLLGFSENCIAVLRNSEKGAKQKHLVFQWTMDSIIKMSAANPHLEPISDEIEVEPVEDEKKVVYPVFKDMKTINHQAALLTEAGTVHTIVFNQGKPVKCAAVKKLNNIVKIESSYTHFLALERKEIPPISEWTPHQVADFITECGFPESAKIAIYTKIDGSQIEEFDEDLYIDTFGIDGVNELQKIRFQVGASKERRLVGQAVYGWGLNTFGQLGLSAISVNSGIPFPRTLPLPEELDDLSDQIVDIKCGKRHSFILTKSGKLWATGGYKEEKSKRLLKIQKEKAEEEGVISPEAAAEEGKKGKKVKKQKWEREFTNTKSKQEVSQETNEVKKKRMKNNHDAISIKKAVDRDENKWLQEKELSVKHRWMVMTEKREQTDQVIPSSIQVDSLEGMDWNTLKLYVNVSQKFVPVGRPTQPHSFVPAIGNAASEAQKKTNKWGTKFKEVDKLMASLIYDQKITKSDDGSQKVYTVCYEDRFLGLLETEVWRFVQDMDIPSHRVRLLKADGEIIWDRKNKYSAI